MKKRPSPLVQKARHNQPSTSRLLNLLARPLWTSILLAIITTIVYWPAVGFDYAGYDDTGFIATNPHVLGGLTWENIRWAFGTGLDGNWIPLTWLSYMLDVEWSGSTAAGPHLTNILLHAANTVLIFLCFRRLTGKHWPSAVLAGLFGLHPLHVESVAWVAERKDVLSTLFWSLAIWTYARYAQEPAAGSARWSKGYVPALVFFALGLMSKPMVVTLPFVLLLLDYWPLRRIEPGKVFARRTTLTRLLCEKIPFFTLAAIASAFTMFGQLQGGAVESLTSRPVGARIANALVAYACYLGKTFWPVDLAIPHLTIPYPLTMALAVGSGVRGGRAVDGIVRLCGSVGAEAAVRFGRMAMVFGNNDPRDWAGSGGSPIHGGSLHLHSLAGRVLDCGVGGCRLDRALAAARHGGCARRVAGTGNLCGADA
jgi:hypothetical protein